MYLNKIFYFPLGDVESNPGPVHTVHQDVRASEC